MNNQEATVEEAVAAAAAERETDEDELEEVVGDTDAISAIGTSQLLFDIVTEEENHDLITLVTCFDLFPYPWLIVLHRSSGIIQGAFLVEHLHSAWTLKRCWCQLDCF